MVGLTEKLVLTGNVERMRVRIAGIVRFRLGARCPLPVCTVRLGGDDDVVRIRFPNERDFRSRRDFEGSIRSGAKYEVALWPNFDGKVFLSSGLRCCLVFGRGRGRFRSRDSKPRNHAGALVGGCSNTRSVLRT